MHLRDDGVTRPAASQDTHSPTVVTSRLTLRPWEAGDLHALHGVLGDPDVIWWDARVGTLERSRDVLAQVLDDNRDLLPRRLGRFAVTESASGSVVGNVFTKPSTHQPGAVEVGWHVRKDRWGHGIATEAARALVDWTRGCHGPSEFVAIIDRGNAGSRVVAARLGMRPGRSIVYDGDPHVLWSTLEGRGSTRPEADMDDARKRT